MRRVFHEIEVIMCLHQLAIGDFLGDIELLGPLTTLPFGLHTLGRVKREYEKERLQGPLSHVLILNPDIARLGSSTDFRLTALLTDPRFQHLVIMRSLREVVTKGSLRGQELEGFILPGALQYPLARHRIDRSSLRKILEGLKKGEFPRYVPLSFWNFALTRDTSKLTRLHPDRTVVFTKPPFDLQELLDFARGRSWWPFNLGQFFGLGNAV